MSILQIRDLSVWYKEDKKVINELNMCINSNEIVGLLGKNGEGKTTLLNTITSLHDKYSGEILIKDSSKLSDNYTKKQRYYVQDYPILFEEMSPLGFFKFLCSIYNKEWDEEKYNYYLERFNFKEQSEKFISSLSLGNKQKTNIIGAFLVKAPLLILDEPLTGLDVISVERFYEEIKKYASEGNAVIFSTHIIDVLDRVCSKVFILNNSRIESCIDINENIDIREEFIKVVGCE